ncbi:hypothetical protein [Hymenobacter latericus]|uniref:hypothetical protein n=1 Tax=Hymenobacter sp. YIM 151858-1 TaxID=2987688 RepID=UPI002227DED9|nr:hypothetical protein [Hymenobacter sp. YIM 151858-1]UYZ60567.1 hypothetical protein OIS50_07150 [Hymenobacter sp. YIM 151858-1]
MEPTKAPGKSIYEYGFFWYALAFLVFLVHLLTSKYNKLYYDADVYWKLSGLFAVDGKFSLLNYSQPLRGYMYPLLNYPLYAFVHKSPNISSQELLAIKISGALYAAAIFGWLAPQLWMAITSRDKVHWLRRLLFILYGLLFWRDYFNFTLSDFPAFAALMASLIVVVRVPKLAGAFVSGVLFACAVYIRPIYIVSAPVMFLVGAYYALPILRSKWALLHSYILPFALGCVLVAIPQWMINVRHFNVKNPLVLANDENYKVNGKPNLYLWQLNAGLIVQRYETNVGTDYPSPQVRFNDLSGKALLQAKNIEVINSYREYIEFVVTKPVDMAALYVRHIFNGLDLLYPTPYVYKVHNNSLFMSFVNYTVLFFAVLAISSRGAKLSVGQWLVVGALLVPCVACIPIVIECRFMLPLHLMLSAVVCFGFSRNWIWHDLSGSQRLRLLGAYGIFVLICFTFSSSTQATLQLSTKIIEP